jgi:exodeoxyribonuclease III
LSDGAIFCLLVAHYRLVEFAVVAWLGGVLFQPQFHTREESIMLIISWNVAGLAPLTKRIHESYNPASAKGNKRARPSVALHEFMNRHGADIFCLQEHKIPLSQLSSRSEPHGCSDVEGYESFWSCCVDTGRQGFNGVVTYARKGMVLSADSSPLGSKDLDEQGRCVMTDHGSFVLFNVYVPASGGTSIEAKMEFLIALRNAMKEQRKRKPVMLVGDLNIKYSALDRPWKDRVVHVDNVLAEVASSINAADPPQWKRQLAEAWPNIVTVLENKRVVATQTQNPTTGGEIRKVPFENYSQQQ